MSQRSTWIVLGVMMSCVAMQPTTARAQSANGTDKAWQVKYHKTTGNPKHNDVAVRLKVRPGTGNRLTATLTRYDKTTGPATNEKYGKRDGAAGEVELTGVITNNAGGGSARKREDFVLAGIYFDAAATPRVITVRGFHHTGKSKTDRNDDQLCVRIGDRSLASYYGGAPAPAAGGIVPAPAPGEPCDEQPPDEDVLTEEVVPDPTPTTPSPDPPYDAGP
jgi:hypothetical protein